VIAAAPVPLRTLVVYGLPAAPVFFTFMLTSVYLLKYAADVLYIAPGVMGVVYGLGRLYDAVTDPVAGWLSDRTRSRLGRRRSWLLASIVPITAGFALTWCPPAALEGAALATWVGAGVFLYYTGTTIFSIPHEALGAEMTTDHHDRTRVFGVKAAVAMLGSIAAIGALQLFYGSQDQRRTAVVLAAGVAVVLAASVAFTVARLREPPSHQGRGASRILPAFRDVLRNPHAVPLLLVFFVENFGMASLGILAPFVLKYVLAMESLTALFIGMYFVPALLGIPVWIRLSRRVGKRRLWLFATGVLALAFSGLFFVQPGQMWLVLTLGIVAGIGGGCGQVVGPSIQADIIDWDELRTGERKEGAYFAVWNFMRKSAFGLAAMTAGLLLEAIGFQPNAEQSEATRTGMRALFGLAPGACFALGFLALLRFRLDEAEHASIRRDLERRALGTAG
jgi:GPH family glycoside/pentoside/hexuronide:cation symporter